MDSKPLIRIQYENWYRGRFSNDLECGHSYGAWYGFQEGHKIVKAELQKEIEELKKQLAELQAK